MRNKKRKLAVSIKMSSSTTTSASTMKKIVQIIDKLKSHPQQHKVLQQLTSIPEIYRALENSKSQQLQQQPQRRRRSQASCQTKKSHVHGNILNSVQILTTKLKFMIWPKYSQINNNNTTKSSSLLNKSNLYCLFFLFLSIIFYFELHTLNGLSRLLFRSSYYWKRSSSSSSGSTGAGADYKSIECTIEQSDLILELFRPPPASCTFCTGIKFIDRISNISSKEFEEKFAYSSRPLIITDAMRNWTAPKTFSFNFLQEVYKGGFPETSTCTFFPYSTGFENLSQVFNMSAQQQLNTQWYIGWSNCHAEPSHTLRQHYNRPYFLPDSAESTNADWIFMGTPGFGAPMHIDHVFLPSWQAQIIGSKRWFLQPPPECYFQCEPLQVDVSAGEIIVLDTNKWYHQTLVLPGSISITIGSEYD